MSLIAKNSDVLALILVLYLPIISKSQTSVPGNDVMLTRAFVDIYDTSGRVRFPVVATSDGGAAFTQYKDGDPRVVKVDSSARFEWFSESRVAGDTTNRNYYMNYMVEDTSDASNPYLFIAGHIANSASNYCGVMIKYRRDDGSYVIARTYTKSGYNFFFAQTLFVNSTGALFVGGDYGVLGQSYSPWLGTVDKLTLEVTEHTVTTDCSSITYVYRILEESDKYVFVGGCTMDMHLWVSAVLKSDWSQPWSYYIGTYYSAPDVYAFCALGAGSYGVLCTTGYYPVSHPGGIKSVIAFTGSTAMTISPGDSSNVLIAGFSTTSFAYVYDPSSGNWYNQGQNVELTNVHFRDASKHPNYDRVWISGYLTISPSFGFVVAVEVATPIVCDTGMINFLNQLCYSAASSSCFGLCKTCLISGNINACSTITSLAHSGAKYLFAGRCAATGKHFRSSTGACVAVTESSTSFTCHKLCGGECIAASNASACAHHCTSSFVEPHIDDSGLANNTCGCQVGYAFNDSSQKCESCGALCGTGGCVAPGDNAKCMNCVPTATTSPVSGRSYVQCACTGNTVASGGACAACHVLCDGCTSPWDNTACNSCVVGGHATTVQTSAPYTCDCASGYVFSVTQCLPCSLYCNGCTAPGNNTKCSACAPIANIQATGSAGAYTCQCPDNCIYVAASSSCLPCHDLCDGCTAANSNSDCVACSSSLHVVTSQTAAPYTCSCDHGFAQSGTQCLPCSEYCNDCSVPADNSKCNACAAISDIKQTGSSAGSYTCECDSTRVLSGTACLPCSVFCDGCNGPGDNTKCLACAAIEGVQQSGSSGAYTCACAAGYSLSGTKCSSCHPLCNGCTSPNSNSDCSACSSTPHVVTTQTSAPYTCACDHGFVLSGIECQACSPYCDTLCCFAATSITLDRFVPYCTILYGCLCHHFV